MKGMAGTVLDNILPSARFRERHQRTIDAPIGAVWRAALEVTAGEIRAFGPLIALRTLPARFLRKPTDGASETKPLLAIFEEEGFVRLDCDAEPAMGRAQLVMGAAGRFWSPMNNAPVGFDSSQDFLDFDEPGFAKTVFDMQATERDGRVELSTETIVAGTDVRANRAFARYWVLIRLPSGLIRRSWLAAIERRALSTDAMVP